MLVQGKNYKTIWMDGTSVFMIEQNKLPFSFEIFECKTYQETCLAIKNMTVRGAGAIGAAAGYAMAQAYLAAAAEKESFITKAKAEIEATRPTARNLFYATERVLRAGKISVENAFTEAEKIADKDIRDTRAIGAFGNELIKDKARILTHCNAGWLAFVDYGTALSPIYTAFNQGKEVFVYVSETRPRGQGARLTAWELHQAGIRHTIIADNAAASLMAQGKIDLVIVGADRIAANGDTANKIGTLDRAILSNFFNIPFYVAAPSSTFDTECNSGNEIIIEERSQNEVLFQEGMDENGKWHKIRVSSPGSSACNPAFDITPAQLITGIITEKGIIIPDKAAIVELFKGIKNE
ncbi:MAG: S-methyl-5-thioribose-1-phosphate isomerase [Bacteroidales bacterium]|nr:S-methyl-5-thioribose-1-phosphate isomerase [Bacteroidales bacterium]